MNARQNITPTIVLEVAHIFLGELYCFAYGKNARYCFAYGKNARIDRLTSTKISPPFVSGGDIVSGFCLSCLVRPSVKATVSHFLVLFRQ